MIRKLLTALPLFLGPLACQAAEPEGRWMEGTVHAPSDRVLWTISRLSLQKMRFPTAGALDPASGRIRSGWKTQLHPFQGEGFRERAEIEVEPIERGKWKVRTRVARQTNEALVSPLDPSRAEWEWTADDPNSAKILLMHITSHLGDEMEFEEEVDPLEALNRRIDGN